MQRLTKHKMKLEARLECFEKRIFMAGDLADFSVETQSIELSHFAKYHDASSNDRDKEPVGEPKDFSIDWEVGSTFEDSVEQIDSAVDCDPWIETVKVFEEGSDDLSKFGLEGLGKTDLDSIAFSPVDKLIDHDPWLPSESDDSDRDSELTALEPPQGGSGVAGDSPNGQDGRSSASEYHPPETEKDQNKPSIQPPTTPSVMLSATAALPIVELPSSNRPNFAAIASVDGVNAYANSSKESTYSRSSLPASSIEAQRFSAIDMGFTMIQDAAVESSSSFESLPLSSNGFEKRSSTDKPLYFVSRQQTNLEVTALRDSFSDQSGWHVADDGEAMISQAISQGILDGIVLEGRSGSSRELSNAFVFVSHKPDSKKSEEGDLHGGNQALNSSTERKEEGVSEKPVQINRSFQQLLGMILGGALITLRGRSRIFRKQNHKEKTLHLSRDSA